VEKRILVCFSTNFRLGRGERGGEGGNGPFLPPYFGEVKKKLSSGEKKDRGFSSSLKKKGERVFHHSFIFEEREKGGGEREYVFYKGPKGEGEGRIPLPSHPSEKEERIYRKRV